MTDPQPHHQQTVGTRRPGLAHIIGTVRPACASSVFVLVFHSFERERPPLSRRVARRDTPDVTIELSQN